MEEEVLGKDDEAEESSTSLVETIISCVNNTEEKTESLVEALRRELATKSEEVNKLQELNQELSLKLQIAEKKGRRQEKTDKI